MQINLQKTFYPSVGNSPTQRKPIYVLSRLFCLEIASVHGWLALHFVFGDWQCPAGQFLEDSPCTVWRSSAIDFLPALAARPASQRREQWDVVGSEWTTPDAWQTGNWCHWRGERQNAGGTRWPSSLLQTEGGKKRDNFKLKSNVASTFWRRASEIQSLFLSGEPPPASRWFTFSDFLLL